jgi:CRISPR-associated protein (TIGR03984 family)
MTTATLTTWQTWGISLGDALATAQGAIGDLAVGLLYSPRECRLAVHREGRLFDEADANSDLSGIFEARIFSDAGELRWWNDPATPGLGRAAYLSEQASGLGNWSAEQRDDLHKLSNYYLLWGAQWQRAGLARGWAGLIEGRIGGFAVPIPELGPGDRVRLCTAEYLGLAEGAPGNEHGNMVVVDERLLRFERAVALSPKLPS